jgi:multimeric flavodoxin WrbA
MLRSSATTTKTKAIGINCSDRLISRVALSALIALGGAGRAILSFKSWALIPQFKPNVKSRHQKTRGADLEIGWGAADLQADCGTLMHSVHGVLFELWPWDGIIACALVEPIDRTAHPLQPDTIRIEGGCMHVLVISSSPNIDGLTAACARAACDGVREAGGQAEEVRLNDLNVGLCEACDNGWGTCRPAHECQVEDDFQALHSRVLQADACVLVTPVYWHEMSESAKAFTDRIRRCEATRGDESGLSGKLVIAVAAAGGSGNGMITCLLSMERWIDQVRARKYDFVPVNRWNRNYKLVAIREAARTMTLQAGA